MENEILDSIKTLLEDISGFKGNVYIGIPQRITRKKYVNIVPKGLYGDVSNDPHMREADGAEAEALSFFMYEEIRAFKCAAEEVGLSSEDVEAVFYDNARRLVDSILA